MPNPENVKPHQWKKGESGNPKGRPKKTYKQYIGEIKDMGYKQPTKAEYFEMIGLLLSMTEKDLKDFANDKSKPYWIRLVIAELNKTRGRAKFMADYRDWLFGSARRQLDITSGDEKITGGETKIYYNVVKPEITEEE